MPATSPSDSSSSSALKPLRSAYFRYCRSSIDAQSQASVPPAPAWMSMKQLLGSAGWLNMRRNSSVETSFSKISMSACTAASVSSSFSSRAISNSSAASFRPDAHAVEHQHHVFQRLAFAAQFLGAGGVVPEIRRFGQAADFFQAVFLYRVVKETP